MEDRTKTDSIDEYIAGFPPATQRALQEVRTIIKAAAPGATEKISYAMPTFDLNGKHLVHFAGYARHIGLYPLPSAIEAFEHDLKPFKQGKARCNSPWTGRCLRA